MITCILYTQVEHEYEYLNDIALFSVDREKAVRNLCWFIAAYIFAQTNRFLYHQIKTLIFDLFNSMGFFTR